MTILKVEGGGESSRTPAEHQGGRAAAQSRPRRAIMMMIKFQPFGAS